MSRKCHLETNENSLRIFQKFKYFYTQFAILEINRELVTAALMDVRRINRCYAFTDGA